MAEAGAEFLLAATLPALSEATGLAQAMAETGLPALVSFVPSLEGLLLDGTPLAAAIAAIDAVSPPSCYLVNCVHPDNVLAGLAAEVNRGRPELTRLVGIQGNASTLGVDELDGSAELHRDGERALVEGALVLRRDHGFQVFGGCCGTDEATRRLAAGLSGAAG